MWIHRSPKIDPGGKASMLRGPIDPKRRPRSSSGETAPTALIQSQTRWIRPAARFRVRGDSSDGRNTDRTVAGIAADGATTH
jgi:hypothetical protein